MIAEFRNKEFGISELIFRGYKTFKDNFISILLIALIVDLPVDIIEANLFPIGNEELGTLTLFFIFFNQPAWIAIAVIVEQYIINGTAYYDSLWIKTLSALKKSFSRWGALLGTSTIFGSLAFFLFLLFLIPGFIFLVNQFFVLEVVALRSYSGNSALSYSKSIVQGRWWKVFFFWIIWFIHNIILAILVGFLCQIIIVINPTTVLLSTIIRNFLLSLITDFFIVNSTIFFLNLDYRK